LPPVPIGLIQPFTVSKALGADVPIPTLPSFKTVKALIPLHAHVGAHNLYPIPISKIALLSQTLQIPATNEFCQTEVVLFQIAVEAHQ
jgi:hypothetical protein